MATPAANGTPPGQDTLVAPAPSPPVDDLHGPRPGPLRLRLFGTPRLFDAAGRLIVFKRGQLGLRLLVYLALQGESGAVAESIFDHVWPLAEGGDEDDEPTGSSPAEKVGKAVKRMQGLLARHLPPGSPAVTFGGSLYRLNPTAVWCDAVAFMAGVHGARRQAGDDAALPFLREALGYYAAPLAEEVAERWFDPVWLDQERAYYQEQACKAGLWAAAILARAEDYAGAVEVYQKLRSVAIVDDEIAQLELICQALRGERALIAQSYDEHVAALNKQGMRPWKATVALYQQLMTSAPTPDLHRRVITTPPR